MIRTQRLSVDGFAPRSNNNLASRVSIQPRPQVPAIPRRAYRAYTQPQPAAKRRRRLIARLQTPIVVTLAMIAGIFAQSLAFGQVAIIVYGLAALLWGIPSRTTFILALISMVATIVLLVARGNVALAQNFATYTFLLLVAGVITLGRELKKEGGRVYSIRQRNIND